MTDFLARLSARTLGIAPIAHPRAPLPFEVLRSPTGPPPAPPSLAQDPRPQQGERPSLAPLLSSPRMPSPSPLPEPTLRAAPIVGPEDGEHDRAAPLVALVTDVASSLAPPAAVPRVATPTSNSTLSASPESLLPPSRPEAPGDADARPTVARARNPALATAAPVATSTIPVTAAPARANPAPAHETRSRAERHEAPNDAAPKIQVTIGRVEVRALTTARAPPRTMLRSLDDYLKPAARN